MNANFKFIIHELVSQLLSKLWAVLSRKASSTSVPKGTE